MEQNRTFEIAVGFFVIFTSIWFFLYAYNKTGGSVSASNSYTLHAKFDNVDGVAPGTEVKISGVKVGSVSSVSIDKQTFLADVVLSISNDTVLPTDTEASVASNGILGNKYIQISPGLDEQKLQPGAEIIKTRGAQSLESLISQFLLSDKSKDNKEQDL